MTLEAQVRNSVMEETAQEREAQARPLAAARQLITLSLPQPHLCNPWAQRSLIWFQLGNSSCRPMGSWFPGAGCEEKANSHKQQLPALLANGKDVLIGLRWRMGSNLSKDPGLLHTGYENASS